MASILADIPGISEHAENRLRRLEASHKRLLEACNQLCEAASQIIAGDKITNAGAARAGCAHTLRAILTEAITQAESVE